MINIDGFESELKKGDIGSGYVFCGLDEDMILYIMKGNGFIIYEN